MKANLEQLEELTDWCLRHGTKPMRGATRERLHAWLRERIADGEVCVGLDEFGGVRGVLVAWFAYPWAPMVRDTKSEVLFIADVSCRHRGAALELARDAARLDVWGRAKLFCGFGRKSKEGKMRVFNLKQATCLIKLALAGREVVS